MVESKKGQNLVNISRNLLNGLNLISKPYAKYQDPSQKRGTTLPYKVRQKKKTYAFAYCLYCCYI